MTRIHLSTRGLHEFTPPELAETSPAVAFQIHIPSYELRDTLSSLLFAHGLVPVSPEHGRSVLISELYEVYALPEPGSDNPPEGKLLGDPDEMASFLEGYWQRAEIYGRMNEQWALQEKERLFDELQGADVADAEPLPVAPFTPRETARAQRIAVEMLDLSEPYRALQSRYGDEEARENLMMFRLFVAGWTGLETKVARDETGKIQSETIELLREELGRLGAHEAYRDIIREIRSLFIISGETEKNSVSPRGPGSSPSGSQASSVELDASAGAWTESNTGPTRSSASPETTATSSSSRSGRATKKGKAGRTAAP